MLDAIDKDEMMIPAERREKIVSIVENQGVVSLAELANSMKVSMITIRRDLKTLAAEQKVQLVFGGVRSNKRMNSEPNRVFFAKRAIPQKRAIATQAYKMIPEGSCIYLDAGTTTLALAECLNERADLTVVTNDFVVSDYLIKNSKCKLIHTGGTVSKESFSCNGSFSALALKNYSIDLAFVSSPAWCLQGIKTSAEEKVAIKQALLTCAKRRVLLCDSDKFGNDATYLALPLSAFDTIITDNGLKKEAREGILKINLTLLTVPY